MALLGVEDRGHRHQPGLRDSARPKRSSGDLPLRVQPISGLRLVDSRLELAVLLLDQISRLSDPAAEPPSKVQQQPLDSDQVLHCPHCSPDCPRTVRLRLSHSRLQVRRAILPTKPAASNQSFRQFYPVSPKTEKRGRIQLFRFP